MTESNAPKPAVWLTKGHGSKLHLTDPARLGFTLCGLPIGAVRWHEHTGECRTCSKRAAHG